MFCKDCVFFKMWKSFGSAMCEALSKPVEPMDKACERFAPKGRYGEWGEESCGCSGACR
ncbi:MAG: hypothetical protein K6T80_03540 [Firmicutes bacterium]|nr:hypothetical protein [Bacillota bacterium]